MITAASDLETLLRQREPAVLLVRRRILRRVIKKACGLGGLGLQVPHRKSYVIERESLLRIANRSELGLAPEHVLPERLILLPEPEMPPGQGPSFDAVLLKYWRLLFHARVHMALAQRIAAGQLNEEVVRQRIQRIGSTQFAEAHAVLRQEYFLLPPDRPLSVYEEFAALYLELRFFARHLLPAFFPSVDDFQTIDQVLAQDVDASTIFHSTRPEGAPEPQAEEKDEEVEQGLTTSLPTAPPSESGSRLLNRADRLAARGNVVRAAILRMQAAKAAPAEQGDNLRTAARQAIDQLADRLPALGGPSAESAPVAADGQATPASWREALRPLLEPAAESYWSMEARLLYDLQKVSIDQERDVYAVDLVEWAVSWGRRPIKRLLPNQWQVRMVKHLRSALHRMTAVRLAPADRQRLVSLLHAAVHHSEQELRDRLRPACRSTLDEVGLKPSNLAEEVARNKLIEELLDRVVERGFLTMSDLRDAVARNQLKLPDLAGPGEFLLGDRLLKANRGLAAALDGVYHRGEIYLRLLQRLSSTAFGTSPGRFLTRFLVLPFGGAFVLLMGLVEIFDTIHYKEIGEAIKEAIPFACPPLGIFFLALLQVASFRRGVGAALAGTWRGIVWLGYELPARGLRLPWVRRILQSRLYLLGYQFVLKPLPWAAVVGLGLHLAGLPPSVSGAVTALVFLAASLLINSRLGLYLEEVSTDGLVRTWHLLGRDVLPGLFRLVMYLSKRILEEVEAVIYTVDEWLRFRSGDNRFSLVWKPVVGLVWFFITYAVRVVVNLFAEPTFNPIKHFPVVTVAAKLLVPFFLVLGPALTHALTPALGVWLAGGITGIVIFFTPGLFGFLVWELKENWKLYASNRPPTLQPIMIGSHGETMLRFMKPGFHSGTLPKLYARLRRKKGRAAHKQEEGLHHVQVDLRRFIDRNLLALLGRSTSWAGASLGVTEVRTATNRVSYRLSAPARLDLEENGGRLTAQFAADETKGAQAFAMWRAGLSAEQAQAFTDALAGFYKLAGVDHVQEPAETVPFGQQPIRWVDWVETWERDRAGKGHEPPLLPNAVLVS
jgi:hypothetical protein